MLTSQFPINLTKFLPTLLQTIDISSAYPSVYVFFFLPTIDPIDPDKNIFKNNYLCIFYKFFINYIYYELVTY